MPELFPFFIVLSAGLMFSELFSRLHLPWVIALIMAGIFIGPHAFDVYEPSNTMSFIGEIGLVFLMFMAGLETKLSAFKEGWRGVEILSLTSGVLPALVGYGLGLFFGFSHLTAVLIGIIFISSSVAVVIPSLQSNNLLDTNIGRSIISATIFQDVVSLILLSVLFQATDPVSSLPLPLFYILLGAVIVVMRLAIPKVRNWLATEIHHHRDLFYEELRSIFIILIGTIIAFELMGLHPIIAGFFTGLVLSDSVENEALKDKLRAVSYGIFIPVFFVLVGVRTDISVFYTSGGVNLLMVAAIVFGSLASKFASGWAGARLAGFSDNESALIGSSCIPQLSTTLAVAFTGLELQAVPDSVVTALVALSVVTTLVSPVLISYFANRHLAEVEPANA